MLAAVDLKQRGSKTGTFYGAKKYIYECGKPVYGGKKAISVNITLWDETV